MQDTSPDFPARFWSRLDDGRLQCDLCPRHCRLGDGQRGVCFVRMNRDDQMVLTTYGRCSGLCVDPIEKKPLNHFYPGSSVLSFGTAGCNLNCKFCQNWDLSRSRAWDHATEPASPEQIARTAENLNCRSVAFTYNDPVVFHEYAVDAAATCHEADIRTVAVTAGYICAEPRAEFFGAMDAANVDLKAFSERFYKQFCGVELAPVLETLEWLVRETEVWVELTTLLIPGENDSRNELEQLCGWMAEHLGQSVPIHFTAFHPDWKMRDHPATPVASLRQARKIALEAGLHYPYVGNVHDEASSTTYCHNCRAALIGRDWYELKGWGLNRAGECLQCGEPCAGVFSESPEGWGRQRRSVRIKRDSD